MEKYIVVAMFKDPGSDNEPTDHYYSFIEEVKGKTPKELAEEYYNNLLLDERVYSANICLIVKSTDYDANLKSKLVLTDKGRGQMRILDDASLPYPELHKAIVLGWYEEVYTNQ